MTMGLCGPQALLIAIASSSQPSAEQRRARARIRPCASPASIAIELPAVMSHDLPPYSLQPLPGHRTVTARQAQYPPMPQQPQPPSRFPPPRSYQLPYRPRASRDPYSTRVGLSRLAEVGRSTSQAGRSTYRRIPPQHREAIQQSVLHAATGAVRVGKQWLRSQPSPQRGARLRQIR